MAKKQISERHKLLVDKYFELGFNETAAAKAAGFAHANHYTTRLFAREDVKAEIAKRREKLAKKHEITQERILAEYAKIAFHGLNKFLVPQKDGTLDWDFSGASEEELAAIKGMTVDYYTEGKGRAAVQMKKFKIDVMDKKAALDSLARHFGMFNDKVTVTGELSLVDRLAAGRQRARARNAGKPDGKSG